MNMDPKLFKEITEPLIELKPRVTTCKVKRRAEDCQESTLVPYYCGRDHECSDCGDTIKFRKIIHYLGPKRDHWIKECSHCGLKIPRKKT